MCFFKFQSQVFMRSQYHFQDNAWRAWPSDLAAQKQPAGCKRTAAASTRWPPPGRWIRGSPTLPSSALPYAEQSQ